MTDTTARIHSIIRRVIKHPHMTDIDSNMDLVRDLDADGLDRVSIAIELEMEFGVEVKDSELLNAEIVSDIEALVLGKLEEANSHERCRVIQCGAGLAPYQNSGETK